MGYSGVGRGQGRRQVDVREGPAVFGASKTLGLISGSLISLALDPAAGMNLDAAPSFRPKAVGVWQREGGQAWPTSQWVATQYGTGLEG